MFQHSCKKSFIQNIGKHYNLRHVCQSSVYNFRETPVRNDIYDIKSEDDFRDRVMRNTIPVIVNFHADWCEPCHDLKPLLEKIANENPGKMHLAEVSVENLASLIQVFEVTAVPAVLAIHRGSVKDKFIGLVSDKEVKNFVQKFLAENT